MEVEFMDSEHLLIENDLLRKVIREKDEVIKSLRRDLDFLTQEKKTWRDVWQRTENEINPKRVEAQDAVEI